MEKQQVREKVGESRFTLFFQWIVALGGRKVGSLKRRVRSHLARWDEKLHAVVARSTCRSQNTQSTRFAPLLEAQMSKKCTSLWREARFQVKSVKNRGSVPLFDVQMSKKCTPFWREAHLEVKRVKNSGGLSLFLTFRCRKSPWLTQLT